MSWSLSQISISCTFFVAKCVYSMLFRLWGLWMIDSGLEASLVLWFALGSTFSFVKLEWRVMVYMYGVGAWCAKLSLVPMLLISGLAGFNQFSKMQAFGLFRGRMSSWCSFRCTCLDELETKLYVNILYLVCCKMCVFYVFQTVRLTDDCIWPGGFLGVVIWFMTKWWCWLLISKTFAGFDVADLRPRCTQSIFSKL